MFSLAKCSLANYQSHTNIQSRYPVIFSLINYSTISCFQILSKVSIEATIILKVENVIPFKMSKIRIFFSIHHQGLCLCLFLFCKSRSMLHTAWFGCCDWWWHTHTHQECIGNCLHKWGLWGKQGTPPKDIWDGLRAEHWLRFLLW